MTLTQTWVGYVDRSYQQIKNSLLRRLGIKAPEISDHSESNPLIVFLSMFAGVAEVLHLYIDAIAREAFIGTARRYSSVVKLAKLIDYVPHARVAASANELITLVDNTGAATTYTNDIIIPKNTILFPLTSTLPFRFSRDVVLPTGKSSVYGTVEQFTQLTNQILATTSNSGAPNQAYALSAKYVHGTLKVRINNETWALYNSLGLMGSTTKGCVVVIDENANAFVVFGDGINGAIPSNSLDIFADYRETEGSLGNLNPGTITQLQSTLILPAGYAFKFTNPDYSSNGTDFEGIEDIRNRAPRSIRTLDRAVVYQDYKDLAILVPGVGAAEVSYCCGKFVYVYVAPNSAGTATLALTNRVKNYMDCRAMITTVVDARPAGVSRIWIKATIIGKPLYDDLDVKAEVLAALDEDFGVTNIEINRRVSVTDIIAIVEALESVDTINIEEVRVEPFARPTENTANILNITFPVLPHTTAKHTYKLVYKDATTDFEMYKDGVFIQIVTIGVNIADGALVTFNIAAGIYLDNQSWEFTIFPSYPEIFPNTVIEITDFSAPIVEVSPLIDTETERTIFSDLTFTEQGSSASCLPSCN